MRDGLEATVSIVVYCGEWGGVEVARTGMEGAGGALRGVKHAADVGAAGGGGGRWGGERRPGGVGRRGRPFHLAVGYAAVADLAWLVLQRSGMAHGPGANRGHPRTRRLQWAVVLLWLNRVGHNQVVTNF